MSNRTGGQYEIYVMSADGSGPTNLTNNPGVDGTPDCQPLVNHPPSCSGVAASPSLLWPPNHKYRTVTLGGATDPDGDPVTLTATG